MNIVNLVSLRVKLSFVSHDALDHIAFDRANILDILNKVTVVDFFGGVDTSGVFPA
jgi:hypothetical protein